MKKIGVFLGFILIVGAFSAFFFWDGILPADKNDKTSKIFVIREGDGLSRIANNLKNEGLIRNRIVFFAVVKQLGIEKNIQAGDFRLNPSLDTYQIAKNLTHGTLDTWITIIEGLRKEEIAQLISKNVGIPESQFLKVSNEGYLFPDTYLIPKDATAGGIVKILEDNFNYRFNSSFREKAKKNNLSTAEVITLASLVEREAKFDEDRKMVANVLHKRLKEGMKLDIDATVQYILGYQPNEKTWWKKNLTQTDLEISSPYNTYKNAGLPPGPIANPGLASIKAVVNSDSETPYLYYVSDKQGHLHFATTLEEQNENIRKYIK